MTSDFEEKNHLILYVTANWWGSDARALGMALRRQGQLLTEVDQGDYLVQRWSALPLRLLRRVARFWLERDLNQAVLARAGAPCVGFLLVFKGTLLRAATLRLRPWGRRTAMKAAQPRNTLCASRDSRREGTRSS